MEGSALSLLEAGNEKGEGYKKTSVLKMGININ